ncbi:hypothetical protein [Erythrobacter sp.]|uniref:hypothetical protein n=1 Tax=Erythrobacter sp. TaxID=1042 RepID=UPI00311E2035
MAEFRQLQPIVSSVKSSSCGGFERHFALLPHDLVSFDQALSTVGLLAHRCVARDRIARDAARNVTQLTFPDGIADADVHMLAAPASDSQEHI